MPDFNEFNKELENENNTVILAVNVEETPQTIKEYLASSNIDMKILLDHDAAVAQSYSILVFLTLILLIKMGHCTDIFLVQLIKKL